MEIFMFFSVLSLDRDLACPVSRRRSKISFLSHLQLHKQSVELELLELELLRDHDLRVRHLVR
jgi:hypothetical protein